MPIQPEVAFRENFRDPEHVSVQQRPELYSIKLVGVSVLAIFSV